MIMGRRPVVPWMRRLSSTLSQLKRMHGLNLVEAGEVFCVEGKDALYAVDMHGCNEPCIMHLDSGDAIVHQQSPPFLMNCKGVWE